jgi:exonuclease SbcD
MKKPLYTISTDYHIDDNNYQQVQAVIFQAIDKSISLGLKVMYVAGDIFNSRKNQTLIVLQTWLEILDYCQEKRFELIVIPGNHDKLDYTSARSYLDPFASHPAMHLVTEYQAFTCGGDVIHMIPFFDEKSTWSNHFDKIQLSLDHRNILITHIAINGVSNNDGSEVEESTKQELFAPFDKVFIGHYHNKQKVGSKLYYIGSIMQKNYGEDTRKGITIVYTDGSHELHELQFTKFTTIKVDLDSVDQGKLKQMLIDKTQNDDNVKVKFSGSKATLDAFDKTKFVDAGFDIKYEYNIVVDLSYKQAQEFTGFDKDKIKTEWIDFVKENDQIDQKQGTEYLAKVL